jgi:hypothetical protein
MAEEIRQHELVSPVDLPGVPIEAGYPLAWASVSIAVAALLLLFANAGTLSGWIDEKPVSETQQKLSVATNGWTAAMDSIGITAPRNGLHLLWKKLQSVRFGDEAPGETQ